MKNTESPDKITGLANHIKPVKIISNMIHSTKLKKILDTAPFVEERQKRKYIPPEIKKQVFERDKYKCVVCGREKNHNAHHKIPYGESILENLITLCEFCHEYVHKILKRKGYAYMSPALAIRKRYERLY